MNTIFFLVSLLYLPDTAVLVPGLRCCWCIAFANRLGGCFDHNCVPHCFTSVSKEFLFFLCLILIEFAGEVLTQYEVSCCLGYWIVYLLVRLACLRALGTALNDDGKLARRLKSKLFMWWTFISEFRVLECPVIVVDSFWMIHMLSEPHNYVRLFVA